MKKISFVIIILVSLLWSFSTFAAERSVEVKGKTAAKAAPIKTFKTDYYALIIGNNSYRNLPKLKTAASDAREVNRVLSQKYGFKTRLLIDASRKDILNAINDYRKSLGEKDSFLIYYAGHGLYDKTADKGYWMPVDSEKDNPTDWIIADDITSNIKRIAAKHVLVVADSCYSGTLTRSAASDLSTRGNRDQFLAKMMERPSRTLMASGGNEPVADSGGRGNHSVFASAFLTALNEVNKPAITAEELFHGRVKEIVAGRSDQVPEYNNIRNSGHEGGDFVFQTSSAGTAAAVEAAEAPPSQPVKEPAATAKPAPAIKGKKAKKQKSEPVQVAQADVLQLPAETSFAPPLSKEGTEGGYADPETNMEFVFVKGGCFQMGDTFGDGDSDEKPVHEVCVDDFYMGKYEVTQAQWSAIRGNNPSKFSNCGNNCPVEQVSWNDVQDYIRILNQRTGKTYRLPTEAEWEYAARSGGKSEKYSGGNDPDNVGWYDGNSGGKTHPVGQKQPNGLGIYDMTGNVWEWCQDWYDGGYYKNSQKDNPQGPSRSGFRVLRGGSWFHVSRIMRASSRYGNGPDNRDDGGGFRLVRTP